MKFSKYNYFVKHKDKVICLNGYSNKMMVLKENEFVFIFEGDLRQLNKKFKTLIEKLQNWNFVIPDDIDEIDRIRYNNKKKIFSERKLWLTINPTLECNFKCWYCSTEYTNTKYERKSMTTELRNSLIKYISNRIKNRTANSIHLDWFGGEPLLYFKEIIYSISKETLSITKKNNIKFSNHITTNAFLINREMVNYFNEIELNSFQITLDGYREKHNSVRNENGKPSYDTIIHNIKLLVNNIKNVKIVLRINYDKQTLKLTKNIVDEFTHKEAKKIRIDFQKVWQIEKAKGDENTLLKRSIEIVKDKGFIVSYFAYSQKDSISCYADSNDYLAVNYDGGIFKCTARGYKDEQKIGHLNKYGEIVFNESKIYEYYSKATFENENCLECNLLPLCFGPCIQKTIELKNNEINFASACTLSNAEINLDTHLITEAKNRNLL